MLLAQFILFAVKLIKPQLFKQGLLKEMCPLCVINDAYSSLKKSYGVR
ncbi:hypothetical protein MCHI_003983 [Candidatus Magnetoovum chiemensis]|nr:hypothetical protein MCHI_003983 [Candidatus Magnetoovum chiemensis]